PLVKELASKYPEQWINVKSLKDQVALKLLKHDAFSMKDITQNGMLYHQRREMEDGQILFVVNSHKTKKAAAEISLKGKHVTKLDLFTGEEFVYPAKSEGGNVSFNINLEPAGSALFVISDKKPESLKEYQVLKTGTKLNSTGSIKVKRESDNILMVNYLDLKTSKSEKKETYFMDALIGLFNENGIEMGNPWQHKIQYKKTYLELDSLFKEDSGFEANYHFQIDENLSENAMNSICAVVERPELWKVSVNGNAVTPVEGKHWIEKDFQELEVGQFLKNGWNTITLKAPRMHILAEVMPVYLLGDFKVVPGDKGFKITGGEISEMGSWREKGLPFYSQEITYSQNFQVNKGASSAYKVKLKKWNGSISDVWVNGQQAGVIAWQPDELDVTKFLKDGENEITVKVTGSLKNTFGFFYNDNSNWIHGPHSWNRAPEKIPPASDYFLMDYGMFEPFELVELN
ncbi:MAG: hypothetical protein R3182_12160, partial [Draconibacterium sp.]|nr:hypothetical protein [Draconibacterium sp.]